MPLSSSNDDSYSLLSAVDPFTLIDFNHKSFGCEKLKRLMGFLTRTETSTIKR